MSVANVWTIFKKEFRIYFNSPIAYILLTVFLVFCGWWFFFFSPFFVIGQAEMRSLFNVLPFIFLFIVPAVSMRLWAEERKIGTVELLLSYPLRDAEVVIGKYLAALGFLVLALALTFPIPVSVSFLGDPDSGPIWGSYIGSIFLAGAYLSIGCFASAVTRDQIVAFVLGLVICAAFFLVGIVAQYFSGTPFIANLLSFLGLSTHFDSIARGVIDSRDVIYYLAIVGFFLSATIYALRGYRQG